VDPKEVRLGAGGSSHETIVLRELGERGTSSARAANLTAERAPAIVDGERRAWMRADRNEEKNWFGGGVEDGSWARTKCKN
jgi:hypothetical protein